MALGSVHGRRHRKKGWMKRKKPTYYGFAGTAKSHRGHARGFGRQVRSGAQRIRKALARGDCRAAADNLAQAYYDVGQFHANQDYASKVYRSEKREGRSVAAAVLRKLKSRFKYHCVIGVRN